MLEGEQVERVLDKGGVVVAGSVRAEEEGEGEGSWEGGGWEVVLLSAIRMPLRKSAVSHLSTKRSK